LKKARRKKPQRQPGNTNTLRIIAGQWRGRKLSFATAPGLRPTPDRVRETLFNWLQGYLHEAHCLDLFAGSGALAFEALSRGAAHVTLIEQHPAAIQQLTQNIHLLKTDKATLIQADAFDYLDQQPYPFDIIFLDPPFGKNYLPTLLKQITEKQLLQKNGLVYLEYEQGELPQANPDHFKTLKEKQAGKVVSRLLSPVSNSELM